MKNLKKVLAVLLALGMLFCFCACGGNDEDKTTTTTTTTTTTENNQTENDAAFKVKVVDENGNALSGAMVQLCKDSCVFKETDKDGVASFDAEITDGYKLSVLACPEGYEYTGDAEVYLESGIKEYTIELKAVA